VQSFNAHGGESGPRQRPHLDRQKSGRSPREQVDVIRINHQLVASTPRITDMQGVLGKPLLLFLIAHVVVIGLAMLLIS
jgi:hypothetical protein